MMFFIEFKIVRYNLLLTSKSVIAYEGQITIKKYLSAYSIAKQALK